MISGVIRSKITNLWRRYQEEGMKEQNKNGGRKRKTTKRVDKAINRPSE